MPKGKPRRINLGAGASPLPGYENRDIKSGQQAYPLADADKSFDEIRASHLLEHFSYNETLDVLKDWTRALKPGGVMRLAVPDFDKIIAAYQSGLGKRMNIEGFLMGGHVDDADYHKALFSERKLRETMRMAGLRNIRRWTSEGKDTAALPISCLLEGKRPADIDLTKYRVGAGMSVPRLGFMDNFFASFEALMPLHIPLRKATGAFWGQCMERVLAEYLDGQFWGILALDYDTVYSAENVMELIRLMAAHPEIDAIAPLQSNRCRPEPLVTIHDDAGNRRGEFATEELDPEVMPVSTAHFGCTLIRASALADLPHPWFYGQPDEQGQWGDGKIDDDIAFWNRWAENGKTLYQANHVIVGHAELLIRWPGKDLQVCHQTTKDYWATRQPPKEAWI